ncbi:unnamed protein product [Staurois parvus]|uniref:[histone H3]-trimethyl-L-lysine(27) demethylase n=1 Tax=Staurois parvus TaxID=386267 RepID=A0ABN9FJL3_9NEOB|nr:unnamed protein product [Staurois parvus]
MGKAMGLANRRHTIQPAITQWEAVSSTTELRASPPAMSGQGLRPTRIQTWIMFSRACKKMDESGLFAPKKEDVGQKISKSPQTPEMDIEGKHLSHGLSKSEGSYSGGKRSPAKEDNASFSSSSTTYHKDTSGNLQVLGFAASPTAPASNPTPESLSPIPTLSERKGREDEKDQPAGCSQLFDFPTGQLAEPFEEATEFAKILPDGLDDIMKMLDESIEKEEGSSRSRREGFIPAASTHPPAEARATTQPKTAPQSNILTNSASGGKTSEGRSGYYGPKKAILGQEAANESKPAQHGASSVLKSLASVLEGQKYSYRGGHSLKTGGGSGYFHGATMAGKRNVDPYTAQSTSHRAWESKTRAAPTSDTLGQGLAAARPGVRTETDILEDIARACETLVEGTKGSICSQPEKEERVAQRPNVIVEKKLEKPWVTDKQDTDSKAKPENIWGADKLEASSGKKTETSWVEVEPEKKVEKNPEPHWAVAKKEARDETKQQTPRGADRTDRAASHKETVEGMLKKSVKVFDKKSTADKTETVPTASVGADGATISEGVPTGVIAKTETAVDRSVLSAEQKSPEKPPELQKLQVQESSSAKTPSSPVESEGFQSPEELPMDAAEAEEEGAKAAEVERPPERLTLSLVAPTRSKDEGRRRDRRHRKTKRDRSRRAKDSRSRKDKDRQVLGNLDLQSQCRDTPKSSKQGSGGDRRKSEGGRRGVEDHHQTSSPAAPASAPTSASHGTASSDLLKMRPFMEGPPKELKIRLIKVESGDRETFIASEVEEKRLQASDLTINHTAAEIIKATKNMVLKGKYKESYVLPSMSVKTASGNRAQPPPGKTQPTYTQYLFGE